MLLDVTVDALNVSTSDMPTANGLEGLFDEATVSQLCFQDLECCDNVLVPLLANRRSNRSK